MDINRSVKDIAVLATDEAWTKCKTCLVEDCRRKMENVLIRKIAIQLQNIYDDDLCNRYAILDKEMVERAFNNFYDHVFDIKEKYLRHRRIGIDIYAFETIMKSFRKDREKWCDELCTKVINRLLGFKMVVKGGNEDRPWSKMFEVKYCDTDFVLVRIREPIKDAYPLILHEFVEKVTNECEA